MIFSNYANGARSRLWVVYWWNLDGKGLRASECYWMIPGTWDDAP